MIFELDERLIFPNPELAEPDGLLAVGGDLSSDRLLLAYGNGIFPWYSDDDPILWYSPHERFVLYANEVVITGSMRKAMRKRPFTITLNTCFEAVITACATVDRPGQDGTWITHDMQQAYIKLHYEGRAHSVEVWQDDQLVGGMYGVPVGRVFCGESMFSKVSNASKAALIWVCQSGDYDLIDCQLYTDHLASMGARMIPRQAFMALLNTA
ncbi:MAG: leucyl/phenylalanyl-tRNA--protein transferase [Mucilaginibacter sp.]